MDKGSYLLLGMGAGVVIGALVGVFMNNVAICLSMGIGIGAVLGAILSTFNSDHDNDEPS
jgi:hypothetical protein